MRRISRRGPSQGLSWLYLRVNDLFYLAAAGISLLWLGISAEAYTRVIHYFGRIPGNDELLRLSTESGISVPAFSYATDVFIFSTYLSCIVLIPAWIILSFGLAAAIDETLFTGRKALLTVAMYALSMLLQGAPLFGWYFGYLAD